MDNFCGMCGSGLDKETGRCPKCYNAPKITDPTVSEKDVTPTACMITKNQTSNLKKTVSVLLCICLFVTTLLSVLILDVKNAVDEDGVEHLLDDVSFSYIVSQVADRDDLEQFFDHVAEEYGVNITHQQLSAFVDSAPVRMFVTSKMYRFCDSFFEYGYARLEITDREISDFLEQQSYMIHEIFETDLSHRDMRSIVDWAFDEDELTLVSTATMKKEMPSLYAFLRNGFSNTTLVVCIVLSVLIALILVKNNLSQAFFGIGTVFIVVGILIGLIALVSVWFPAFWQGICGSLILGTIIGNFTTLNVWPSIILLAVGVVMLIIRKKILKRNQQPV